MMNTALFMNLIDRYNHIAYTHEYIWGLSTRVTSIWQSLTALSWLISASWTKQVVDADMRFVFARPPIRSWLLCRTLNCSAPRSSSKKHIPLPSTTAVRFSKRWSLNISVRFGKRTTFLLQKTAISQLTESHIRSSSRRRPSATKRALPTLKDKVGKLSGRPIWIFKINP